MKNGAEAIRRNPDYFLWWYTAKSIGVAVAAAAFTYMLGREHARKQQCRNVRAAVGGK